VETGDILVPQMDLKSSSQNSTHSELGKLLNIKHPCGQQPWLRKELGNYFSVTRGTKMMR
jgi:hypothetical protein